MQYLLHLQLSHNIPVHTKLSILYIVFVLFLHIVFLNICILLFLLSVSCPDSVTLWKFCLQNKFLICANIPDNKADSDSETTIKSVTKGY